MVAGELTVNVEIERGPLLKYLREERGLYLGNVVDAVGNATIEQWKLIEAGNAGLGSDRALAVLHLYARSRRLTDQELMLFRSKLCPGVAYDVLIAVNGWASLPGEAMKTKRFESQLELVVRWLFSGVDHIVEKSASQGQLFAALQRFGITLTPNAVCVRRPDKKEGE